MKKNNNDRTQSFLVDIGNTFLCCVNIIYIITNLLGIDVNAYESFSRASQTSVLAIITMIVFLIQIWSYRKDASFFRQFFGVGLIATVVAIVLLVVSKLVTHSVLGIVNESIVRNNQSIVGLPTRYYFAGLVFVQIVIAFLPVIKSAFNIKNMSKNKQDEEGKENKEDM